MILVYCFCTRDQELALENIKWWNELGGCKGHSALVGYDPRCDATLVESIRQEFIKAFDKVFKLKVDGEIDGWPEGANYFMRLTASELQDRSDCRYFLWMEPDAIPMREGWLDALEAEYKTVGKPFMGEKVDIVEVRPDVPIHMSGIGIYWNPLHQKAGEAYRAHEVAWDIAAKDQIVPQAHFTKLIQHSWKHPPFTQLFELSEIRPETMVFHASKDGSLIRLLRQKRESASRAGLDPTALSSVPPPDELHAVLHKGPIDADYFKKKPDLLQGGQTESRLSHKQEEVSSILTPATDLSGSVATKVNAEADRLNVPIAQQPVQIKKLPNDIWVIEGESIISGQVLAENRLDIDKLIPKILPYINDQDTVIDIGAYIGDHTVSYAKAASRGWVYAFEPNPIACECLKHNTETLANVSVHNVGMSDFNEVVPLSGNEGQTAGAYIGEPMKIADVILERLDNFNLQPDLIKIDVEGYELKVLQGAAETITLYKPKLVIEINPKALQRQDAFPDDIFEWLDEHGYKYDIIIDYRPGSDWYDIIALPGTEEKTRPVTAVAGSSNAIPVAAPSVSGNSPLTPYGEMLAHVEALADYCTDGFARMRVQKALQMHKIIKKKRK